MNKNALKGAGVLLSLCLVFGAVGCQKSDDKAKTKENQAVSSEEAGMTANGGKENTFKPADYTLPVKDEYVYEFLGLKFQLSD
ncbi:MAG: TlpA family protein disulfide reductase, partial [Peptostreptococcus sp.]|nr:TlpA family protein disulfide reductase [Peptostreptococcus sp.]